MCEKGRLEKYFGAHPGAVDDVDGRRKRLKVMSLQRVQTTVTVGDFELSDYYTQSEDGYHVLLRWYSPRVKG